MTTKINDYNYDDVDVGLCCCCCYCYWCCVSRFVLYGTLITCKASYNVYVLCNILLTVGFMYKCVMSRFMIRVMY